MFFADETRAIKLKLSGAVTTNQLPIVAAWTETTTVGAISNSSAVHTVTNGTSEITIVGTAAAGKIRKLQGLSVQNADTVAAVVNVYADDESNERILVKVTLAVGDQLVIGDDGSWRVLNSYGAELISTMSHSNLSGLSSDDHTQYALLAGRSGGQTLIGSILSGEKLTLQSTSHSTKGGVWLADDDFMVFDQISAPSTPSSGKVALYAKSDKALYFKDDTGTENLLGAGRNPKILYPKFFSAGNATAVTALTTGLSHFMYIGDVVSSPTSVVMVCRVTTAVATSITWAEVGIFQGSYVTNGNASLTRLGYTDVTGTFNSTGIKTTTITISGGSAGPLWIAYGSAATTPFQLRGLVVDDIQSGSFQTASQRLSTAASPQAVTLAGATVVPAWSVEVLS